MKNFSFVLLCLSLIGFPFELRAEGSTDTFTLERALDQALQTNFQIRAAQKRAERESGSLIESRAELLPQVRATGSYTRIDEDNVRFINATQTTADKFLTARVEATQSLFVGGKELASTLRDTWRKRAAVDELKAVVNDVMLTVREQFYLILLQKAQVVVREQAIELLDKELTSQKNKRDAGIVSNFNVLRAEVALANAQTPYIKARNDLTISLENFRRVLGLNQSEKPGSIDVEGELEKEEIDPELNTAIERAFIKRPELSALEKRAKAESRNVWAERGGFLPQVKAFGAYQGQRAIIDSDNFQVEEGWEAGVRGEWEVFNSGSNWGQIKKAKADRSLARIEWDEAMLSVEIEVRQSYSSLIEAIELLKASEKVVEQAQESLRLAESRFNAGVATQLDVLDSQVSLTEARTNRVQALYDFKVSLARFRRAQGDFVR